MMAELVKDFPDAVLLIAGNGPEKNNLENQIAELNLQDNVKMLGYCTCLEKYQRIADISVSCSKREGLPLNIVEAMLTKNPVVATVNRGHCELITDGQNGYIVAVDDIDAMYERIRDLLSDENKCVKIGNNARNFALQYGFNSVKKELTDIYY